MGDLEKKLGKKSKKIPPIDFLEEIPNEDRKKYYGKHVVYRSFNNKEILAYGEDIGKIIKEAKKKGAKEPVIVFIRDPNITYIYNVA